MGELSPIRALEEGLRQCQTRPQQGGSQEPTFLSPSLPPALRCPTAAFLWSYHPDWKPEDVHRGQPPGPEQGGEKGWGAGRVCRAMQHWRQSQSSSQVLLPQPVPCAPCSVCLCCTLRASLHACAYLIHGARAFLLFQRLDGFDELAAHVAHVQMYLPPSRRMVCKTGTVHLTHSPWNSAHDSCSTNGGQMALFPSCFVPSCWSFHATLAVSKPVLLKRHLCLGSGA